MNGRSSPKFILGYTDTKTVMLDFDHIDLDKVKYWAKRAMRYFKLGGFLILESSEKCYHVVFNRKVTWSENMSIVASVTLLSHNQGLRRWQLMQCRKQSSTLRVSNKGDKPNPCIVYREGIEDVQIKAFLEYQELINNIMGYINNLECSAIVTNSLPF